MRCFDGRAARFENAPVGEEAIITLRSLHPPLLLGLSVAVAFGAAGCATSDPLMPPDLGTGGTTSTAAAGATGTAQSPVGGSTGTGGAPGSGGSTGAAGTKGGGGGAGAAGTLGGGRGGTGGVGSGGSGGSVGSGGSSGSGGRSGSGAAGNPWTGPAPTFTQVYNDVIVTYCAGSACHNPGRSGGASFKTKSSAYTVFSQFVMPSDVADSDMYGFLTSDPPFMPPRDPIVPSNGAAELAAWISAGAQNN